MQNATRWLATAFALALFFGASGALAQEEEAETPTDSPEKAAAPSTELPPSTERAREALPEGTFDDPGVIGGRDIEPPRPLHVVWRELVETRNQLYVIVGDRDMRSVVLSQEEQSLIVAFSKRAFDLCAEFDALSYERLDGENRYPRIRTALRFLQAELAEIRSVSSGPIHRNLPAALTQLTIRLRGVYLSHDDHPAVLGTQGLPPNKHEDETVPLPVFKGEGSSPAEEPEQTPSS